MKTEWEICRKCSGDGFILSYAEDDPYGDYDNPVEVPCAHCNRTGKLDKVLQPTRSELELYCHESGIAPGSDDWNDIVN